MRLLCRDPRATSGEEEVILAPQVLEAAANLNMTPDRVDISSEITQSPAGVPLGARRPLDFAARTQQVPVFSSE